MKRLKPSDWSDPIFGALVAIVAAVCMIVAFLVLVIVFLTSLFAGPADAQSSNCAPRAVVVERLAERYRETRQSIGLAANNSVVEVFAAHETGTWTITVTLPNGLTCLVASGQSFEATHDALPAPGEDL